MNTNKKLIALTTATLIALAPTTATASAMSFSDNVFSWPTDYKSEKASTATSTFDGKVKNLEIKEPIENKTQTPKRK